MKTSEFRKLIREEVRKVIKEGQGIVVSIGDEMARSYNMDIEELQDNADNEYNFAKYREGIDYEWSIGRGDDFPNAITIKNSNMVNDPKVKEFLNWAKESKAKGYQESKRKLKEDDTTDPAVTAAQKAAAIADIKAKELALNNAKKKLSTIK